MYKTSVTISGLRETHGTREHGGSQLRQLIDYINHFSTPETLQNDTVQLQQTLTDSGVA